MRRILKYNSMHASYTGTKYISPRDYHYILSILSVGKELQTSQGATETSDFYEHSDSVEEVS